MRFGALDTLRGIAAIAVVMFHLAWLKSTGDILPHAYLAVDFFFVLSGFVIAHAYEERLAAGMPAGAFMRWRLIRLYPMVFMAVALAAMVLALKAYVEPVRVDPPWRAALGIACNLLLMPDLFGGSATQGVLFPGNGPLWSIALEVLINGVWCLWLTRLTTRNLLVWVVACFGLVVLFTLGRGDADLGFNWQTLPGGLARVGYGFGLGALLYRIKDRLVVTRGNLPKVLAAATLVGTFAMPWTGKTGAALWDILCVGAVVPLVMTLGLNGAGQPRLDRLLGDASYPLYAIHFPILSLFSGLHRTRPQLGSGLLLVATALALAVLTMAVARLYDLPTRRWLMARWGMAQRHRAHGSVALRANVVS